MKKTIIKIALTLAAISTLLLACTKSVGPNSNEKNLSSMSLTTTEMQQLDELSTLNANLINAVNQLDQDDFCTFKSIIESTDTPNEKFNLIAANDSLSTVYTALSSLSNYTSTNNPNDLLASDESKQSFCEFLKPKVSFLDEGNKPNAGLNCNAYLSAHNSCTFGYSTCLTAIFFAGPEAWAIGAAICTVTLMACINSNDKANPECAAYYQWSVLPRIPDVLNVNDICN